jgi:Ser/Thr protein kinase RdoA (MazF antagonist)
MRRWWKKKGAVSGFDCSCLEVMQTWGRGYSTKMDLRETDWGHWWRGYSTKMDLRETDLGHWWTFVLAAANLQVR